MVELVMWKPLYYASIGAFLLSLALYPISQTMSVVVILAIISIWTKIPGYVHFIFNKLALIDLFTFIVGAYLGSLAGSLFGTFVVLFGRIFGVNEYIPYTVRCSTCLFIAGWLTPLAVSVAGGININALLIFEGIFYALYYAMVFLFFKDEISLEMGLLPATIFFDFMLNATWLGSFGGAIGSLMTNGIASGWTFIIFAGIVLIIIAFARNAKKLGEYVSAKMSRNTPDKEKITDKNKEKVTSKEDTLLARIAERRKRLGS